MIAKEWRDARWKLLLGALAFLVIAVIAPRPYEKVLASVDSEVQMMEREIQKPVRLPPTEGPAEAERFKRQMREDLEEMREPGYPARPAGWELEYVQASANYAILVPLAGLLGVTLVSAEVGQGSIYLLLSKPLSRRRMLLTNYAVCAACLLVVALAGAVGILLSAVAHGYPPEAVNVGRTLAAAALIWLGSLFVLWVALLASTIFGGVIQTILAAAAALYLIYIGRNLARSLVEGIFWTNDDYMRPGRDMQAWYDAFESWTLSSYWGTSTFGGGPSLSWSFAVCLATVAPPLRRRCSSPCGCSIGRSIELRFRPMNGDVHSRRNHRWGRLCRAFSRTF